MHEPSDPGASVAKSATPNHRPTLETLTEAKVAAEVIPNVDTIEPGPTIGDAVDDAFDDDDGNAECTVC